MTTRAASNRQKQNETSEEANSQLSAQLSEVQITDEGSSDNGDPDPAEHYGDMHKLVLQGMMAAGYLDAKGVKKLFQESCKQLGCETPAEESFFTFVQKVVRAINDRIKNYDMVIKSATCEISGGKFYVLLITIEKQIMKLQTYFTKVELQLFQKIIDTILRKDRTYTIPLIECINMGANMNVKGFSKLDAEDFVTRMMALQYFKKVSLSDIWDADSPNAINNDDEFEITLGFRTIREFEPIFRECYQDCFKNCCMCKAIMLNGYQCRKCTTVTHRACFKLYNKKVKRCPNCKNPWKSEKSLVVRRREEYVEPSSSSQNTSPTTRGSSQENTQSQTASPGKRRGLNFTGGEEVDMPILEPMVSPGSAGATQSKSQAKSKNKRDSVATSSRESSPKKKVPRPGPASSKRQVKSRKIVEESDSD